MIGELVAINHSCHDNGFLANLVISNNLIDRIKLAQVGDKGANNLYEEVYGYPSG